ncbi:MAG: phosphatidylglycerol lysyltransferase domain-containing protein, partial [Endomicrobium sp.]|nr:phosphatidylglycerol lysyltransferase domain-containing protein [Endomicrobium sp.]
MKRKKWLSVLLAAVFAFGVIGQDFACAANMANAEMMLFPVLQNSKPQLFDNFAKITDFANFGGETLVLNIQDFHLNPEVQKNISSIIDILVKNYGIKNVYVEGASGKVSTSWLSDIKDEKIRKEVTNGLLDEGALTASEYYASLNGKKDFIYGIEDAKIHDINVKRLAGIIELKPYYAKIIERMSDDLDFLQNKYFNVNNKRFENFVKRYKNGKIAAKKYYATLFKYLNRNSGAILLPADARDYPNIVLFLRFDDLQKRLNESKLLRQLNEIILKVKETLPYSSLPKNGDLDEPDKILAYLQSLPKDFQEKYFSLEIQNFITLRNLYLQINPVALIKEERTLINEIRTGFAQSSNELEISFLSDFFLYFSDYMTASISADNYEYLLEKFEKFETLWEKHSYYNNSLFEARPFFDLLNAYYAANDKRNGIFLDVLQIKQNGGGALKSSENFEELLSDAKNISVVITGGYHSKGVSEILKQKGISYAVLTPYVNGDISKTLVNYENLALEQAGFPSQTLALALASQSSDVKKAQLLFSWAQKNLVEVLHTQENINFLIEKLNESSGGNIVFTVSDSVIYANGKPFADISENKDGKITIKKHQKFSRVQTQSDGNFLTPEKSRALLKDFYSVFNATSLNFGSNIVVPNFYPALKSFAEFASKNKLFRGGGLVFDIAGISNPKESIDDVETRLVARMPDFLQKAINENQIKKEDFKNNDDWLKFLWVSGLLNDFISGKTRSEKQKFSLIKSLFYAPFSELEEISAAIAAKASGDDSLYEKFINKHNYDGKQKDQLSSGVLQIYNAVINLLAKHAGARRIRNTVIRMHFAYNLKVILKAFFQNFVRAFKGERFIYPAVMTVSVVVKKKNAAAVIKNIDEIRKLHPEAIIPENVESLTEGFNIEFDDEETAETFRTGALRNFILAERNAGANNEEKNSAVQVAADTAIAAVKPISFPSSLADIISNEVIEDITKENRFTYNDRDGFVKNALSKTVKEIINNPQSDKARSVKRQLKSFGVSLGSVKTDKEKSLILTDSGEGSTPFSIEIRQDGTISKYYYVQRDGSGGFNDKSPIIKSASLLAYTGISLYKAVNALLVFGDSLPESKSEASLQEKDENYKQDEVLLVYADESLDKISLLIRLLFEGADDLGTVLRQTEEANAARRHFEKLGITFEYDDLRYLNKDSVLVYKNNKPILRLVFGNALGKIRFHNLISVVNVETRKEELKQQEKNKDLFYLFDLLALTDEKNMLQTAHLDGKEVEELSNAQKVFKDLFDYSSAIKNGDITYLFNKRGDYDVSKLLRYQTSDLSAQEQSYLELRAPSAAVKVIFENNGLATFYFDPSNRREAQKLISEIENAKAERAQKENVDYSWRENKDALKKLAQNLYSDFTKDVSDGHINKIKTQYDGVFIEADGFYTNPENAAKARINFNGSFIDIEDGEIFVYTRRLYDADGNPLKYLFKQKINDSSQIDAKELKEFINFLISYGAQLNDVSLQTSVPAAAEFTGKSYAGKETIAALTNAAAQVFLDHNSYNENALVKLLKEKYGAETDFSQYFFNYTGFDLSLFNEKDKDPYLERRRGSGVLSLKIPNSPLGDLYLFIADGKIWFDYRNGYANFRSWHYSNTEEEIAGLYAKDNAVQNALYSDAFVANAQSADGKSVNVLLSNILEDIIKYGSAQNAGNQKKQLEGISLYEGYPHKKAVSQGLAAQKDPEEVFKYYSEHMKGEVAVGAAYVPTQNTLYLAQAVKKVFEEKDFKNSHIKKYFDGLLKKFPYPAEILLTSEGVEIRVGRKDKEAQEDFRTGIIINKDGRVLEIKDRQYADENKQRFVQINNTLYLTSPQNQDSDLHYLYSGKELTELTGVKYKAQRNGIVKFSKKHDFSYEDLDENNIEEFAKALYSWVGKTGEPSFSKEQLELAVERIKHFGIKSGFVRVNGKIAAFAVGEYVGDGEFDIYIQKSDNSINGLINTINHLFIRENFSEGFLNFEEDLSIEGLRKMKLSYFPLNKTREYGDADLKYHSGILFTGFIEEAINYGKEEPAAQESEALEEYKILKTHISKAGPVLEKLKEEFDGKYTQNQDANGVITFEVSPEIYEKFKEVLFPVKKTAVVAVGAALGGAAVGALPGLSAAVAGAANAGSDYSDPQVQKFLQRAVEKIIENPSLLSVFNKDAPDAPSAIKAPKALIGISKGGQKYLYITPNQSDLKFNVIIYPYDYKNVKAGQPVKGFIADKESGRFEDLSQVSYAAVSAAAAETIEKLIDLGKTLPETKTEKPRQENIVSELIEIDAAFDSLGVLAKSLFDSYKGDKKTWENIEKTLKDRLKAAGIDDVEFEVSDEVRYLNCDYFSVSVKGEKLFTVVFGHPIYDDDGTLIKFQNVINIIDERSDAANRKRYPDSTKHEDLLHLSDLAGFRAQDIITSSFINENPDSPVSKTLKILTQTADALSGKKLKLSGGSNMPLRYQVLSKHILAKDIEELKSISADAKSLDGVETFYFNLKDRQNAQELINRAKTNYENDVISKAQNYSLPENKSALTNAAKSFWLGYINGEKNEILEKFKEAGVKIISADL